MKAISQGNIKRFLVAAGVALAVPLTAVAFQGHPGGHHGCGGFAGHGGPGMMGGEMMPPHLRGLNLTEAQRDKIFEIMRAGAGARAAGRRGGWGWRCPWCGSGGTEGL